MNDIIAHIKTILNNHSIHIIPATISCVLICVVTWYSNKFLKKAIVKVGQKSHLDESIIKIFENVLSIAVYVIGGALLLENLHIKMSSVLGTVGIFSVAIGLASQKVFANMSAGMFLLIYKPFKLGDYIQGADPRYGKFEGKVMDINLRTTTLKFENDVVLIPNQNLYEATVTIKGEMPQKNK
jgi:small conductance mechanosensitive channel